MTDRTAAVHDAERLLRRLEDADARLILSKGETILFRSGARGVRPLLEAVDHPEADRFLGASAADTTVGRAAALVFAHLGITFVAAGTLSDSAAEVLRRRGIESVGRVCVPVIAGRTPGKPCPFETAVAGIEDPGSAIDALRRTAARMFRAA